jgi:hypothetical protein
MRGKAVAKHGRIAWRTKRVIDLPHEGDLSERPVQYLKWAGVSREELFVSDATRASRSRTCAQLD